LCQPLHRFVELKARDVRDFHVARDDSCRKDQKGDDEICRREARHDREEIDERRPNFRAPTHATASARGFRSRAANAPSVACCCGSTRRYPRSMTSCGTTPSGGGSSVQPLCSERKRSICASFSSGSSEQVLYTSRPPGRTAPAAA